MWKRLLFGLIVCGLILPRLGAAQDAKTVLSGVAKAMRATDVNSLEYTGSGSIYALGQNPRPGTPWVRYNAKSYTRSINYDTVSMRDDLVRTQSEQPPRGAVFVIGEQRQTLVVSGTHAWNQVQE